MVGHSLVGPYVMTFTKQFGADVAGLVFVDASHPDQLERIEEATGQPMEEPMGPKLLAALAWTGLPRLMAPSFAHPKAPEQANAAMSAFLPTSGLAMLDELAMLKETFAESGTFRSLGDRPLVVLTAMAPLEPGDLAALKLTPEQGRQLQAAWLELHEDEATWSSRARHVRVDDARHYIQFDRPDAVIEAIREVVQSITTPPGADSKKAEAA
jgi:pimeloyl-ACP methyl ester carboxylesterase